MPVQVVGTQYRSTECSHPPVWATRVTGSSERAPPSPCRIPTFVYVCFTCEWFPRTMYKPWPAVTVSARRRASWCTDSSRGTGGSSSVIPDKNEIYIFVLAVTCNGSQLNCHVVFAPDIPLYDLLLLLCIDCAG